MMREVHEGLCAFREHHDVIEQQDTINGRYAEGHLRLMVDEGDGAIIFCQKSAIGVGKGVSKVVSGFVISGETEYFPASSTAQVIILSHVRR